MAQATLYSGASYQPLGKQSQPLMRAHDIFCFHTMVGSLDGTDAMFEKNGYKGTESHWGVGYDGECIQWQDIAYTADANLDGNGVVLSVENADVGTGFAKWNLNDGNAVPAFTAKQIARLIDLGYRAALPGHLAGSLHAKCPKSWDCYKVGIPARLIPDTKPGRRGFAYHAQGVPGNGLVAGGVAWSSSRGKVCPGARRIAQVKNEIIPGIAARLAGHPAPPAPQEDEVVTNEDIQKIADAVWAKQLTRPGNPTPAAAGSQLAAANVNAYRAAKGLDVSALASQIVAKMPTGQPATEAAVAAALRDVLGGLDG